jgi:glycosyltransferase involved in cell wall biosynthesis
MDHYLVHSEFTRDGLINLLGIEAGRITVLPIWIDSDKWRPIAGSRQMLSGRYGIDFDDGSAYLAYVGSELPRKNLSLLLESMAILKSRGRRVKLIKIGGAGGARWRAKLKQDIERLGLSDEVVLTGIVPEEDLVLLINAADVCVTATLLESTFAWVALTAMACGRPSVATAAALIPKEAEEAVIVVPDRDAHALALAIETCVEDGDLARQMGEAGRRIIRGYRGEITASAMVDVYRQLPGSST